MAIYFYGVLTLLIVLTAAFSYINLRYLKLPPTIGIMVIALLCSLLIVFTGQFSPSFKKIPQSIVNSLDFESLLMRVMLSFLLFAGAVHTDVQKLKKQMVPIMTFATVGLRGGISVALALSLPYSMHRNEFVSITYIVVVFSIIAQGLTIGRLAKKLGAKEKE